MVEPVPHRLSSLRKGTLADDKKARPVKQSQRGWSTTGHRNAAPSLESCTPNERDGLIGRQTPQQGPGNAWTLPGLLRTHFLFSHTHRPRIDKFFAVKCWDAGFDVGIALYLRPHISRRRRPKDESYRSANGLQWIKRRRPVN